MLSVDEWRKLRAIINAWPHDGDRILMHRVINRERLTNNDNARLIAAEQLADAIRRNRSEVPVYIVRALEAYDRAVNR